jgi:hypothetical protein
MNFHEHNPNFPLTATACIYKKALVVIWRPQRQVWTGTNDAGYEI